MNAHPQTVRARLPSLAPILALVALGAVALAFVWRPVLLGEVFLPADGVLHMHPWRYSYERVPVNNTAFSDQVRQIYPRRLLVNTILAGGELPLWNRTVLSGMPMLDDGQLALFYPPSLIFLLAPLNYAFGLYAFVHLWIAGAGALLLARRLGLGWGAACLAGACYATNGHMLTWLQFPHHTGAQAMLPWAFWAVERAITRGAWRAWVLAAVPMALMVLTQIQLAFYAFTALGVYALYRAAQTGGWRAGLGRMLGLALATLLSLALSAAQLLPAAALSAQGQRSDVGFALAPPEELFGTLLRLVLPALGGFERIGPPPAWGPPLLQVAYPYVGLATLLLAGAGLLLARHALAPLFGLLAIGSFALAARTPLMGLLFTLLPPYRQFDIHLRWYMIWGLAAAVLAGMGAQALADRRAPRDDAGAWEPSHRARVTSRGLLGGALLVAGVFALWHLQPLLPGSRVGQYLTAARQQPLLPPLLLGAASLVGIALLMIRRVPRPAAYATLVALVALDMTWHGGLFNTSYDPGVTRPTTDLSRELAQYPADLQSRTTLYPPTRQVAFLQSQSGPFRIFGADYTVLTPNMASTYGLEDIRGYMSLYTARYNQLARLADGKDYRRTSDGTASLRVYFSTAFRNRRLLDMLNVQYFIFAPDTRGAEQYAPLELVHESDEGRIYRNPQALPRAWLVHRAETIPDDEAQLDRMARADFDPAVLAVVDRATPALEPAQGPEPTPEVAYANNAVTVRAAPSAPALLVLADTYYDGWEVRVDGVPAPLYRVNYTLRGVWLPAGEHVVEFVYRPPALVAGVIISGATLLALALVGALAVRGGRTGEIHHGKHIR
ncbi:MAG: hypothetical protein RLZZ387_1063 [Chloroflexota bacterium]